MRTSTFPVFLSLLAISSASTWRMVRLPQSNSWIAVREIEKGSLFWLAPHAIMTRASLPKKCSSNANATIDVCFWNSKQFKAVEQALFKQGLCKSWFQCRLEPYQVKSIALRDQFRMWKALRPTRFLPIVLPPCMTFHLRRDKRTTCSRPTVNDLQGLMLEMQTAFRVERLSVDASRLVDLNGTQLVMATEQPTTNTTTQPVLEKRVILNTTRDGVPIVSDCVQVKLWKLQDGLYYLQSAQRVVHCTSTGEVVVLRRTKMDLSFNQRWAAYRQGLSSPERGDFFLGLSFLNSYTADGDRCMRLILRPLDSTIPVRVAEYSNFRIDSEAANFRLTYKRYKGSTTKDTLAYHKNTIFSTDDRNNKKSCANRYKSGNWFNNCYHINLFGRFNFTKPHDGFASRGISKAKTSAYISLRSAYMTLRSVKGDPEALITLFSVHQSPCPAKVRQWSVPDTADYLITIGGAAGGNTPHLSFGAGGRGALASGRAFLRKGTKLGIIVGCQGATGHFSGAGGDATVVTNRDEATFLVVAGGGGGGGWAAGSPGRDSSDGGQPLLAPGIPANISRTAARGWLSLRAKALGNVNVVASSGGLTWSSNFPQTRGGGGGGGYSGGWAAEDGKLPSEETQPRHSSGGGGGSACNTLAIKDCKLVAGGNSRSQGFITIEAYRCF